MLDYSAVGCGYRTNVAKATNQNYSNSLLQKQSVIALPDHLLHHHLSLKAHGVSPKISVPFILSLFFNQRHCLF